MKKLLSRKFLLALVATVISVAGIFGIDNGTLQIAAYAGAIMVNVIYILVEGKIDKAALTDVLKKVSTEVEQFAEKTIPPEDTTASTVESTEQSETAAANQATTSTLTLEQAVVAITDALKAATTAQ
jgi:hypothetical protein